MYHTRTISTSEEAQEYTVDFLGPEGTWLEIQSPKIQVIDEMNGSQGSEAEGSKFRFAPGDSKKIVILAGDHDFRFASNSYEPVKLHLEMRPILRSEGSN